MGQPMVQPARPVVIQPRPTVNTQPVVAAQQRPAMNPRPVVIQPVPQTLPQAAPSFNGNVANANPPAENKDGGWVTFEFD